MTRVRYRWATDKDIDLFFTKEDRPANTMRAKVAELDGVILGIAGIIYVGHNNTIAFSHISPEAKFMKKDILRFASMMRDFFNEYGSGSIAIASKTEKNAPSFLLWIGFNYIGKFDGMEIFGWPAQTV